MLDPYIFLAMVRVELTCTVVLQAYRQTDSSKSTMSSPSTADGRRGRRVVRMCAVQCTLYARRHGQRDEMK